MPSSYTSFRIKNTTDVPIHFTVRDPGGNFRMVGALAPGKESLQVAPVEASWSIERSSATPRENTDSPMRSRQTILTPDASRIETTIDTSPQLLGEKSRVGRENYAAFLKIETGSHTARINQLLVTPDGKSLVTSGEDKTIRIWDIEGKNQAGMLLGEIGEGGNGMIQAITMSRDGKFVLALAWIYPEGTHDAHERETDVRVYELATGNLQARFRYPGTLQDLDFSSDDNYLAMVGNPMQPTRCGYVYVYDARMIMEGFGDMPAPLASAVLYDNDTLIPSYVRFVPEEPGEPARYRIVAATWIHNKFEPDEREYTGRIFWYSYSAEGIEENGTCETAEFERKDPPAISRIRPDSLAVSQQFVITTAENKDVREFFCYDHNGQLVNRVPSETTPAQPVFSKDGSQLIIGQREDSTIVQVKVYNTALGQFHLKSTYYGHDAETKAVALLQDSTAVSAGGDQNSIHFWSPAHLEGQLAALIRGRGRAVHAVGVNELEQIGIGTHDDLRIEDGRTILQRMFDLRTMSLTSLSLQDYEAADFQRSQIAREGKTLEFKLVGGYWNLWLDDEQPLTGLGGWYYPATFGFTKKGHVITGDSEGVVRFVDLERDGWYQPAERLLIGHTARVLDHAASSKWLVTAGKDQIIRLWYMEDVEQDAEPDLEPALNLFVGVDDEWVIWSKSGYYMASQNGDRYLGYHINRGPDKEALYFSSDRFHNIFFRPEIIKAILVYGSEERVTAHERETHISIKPVNVAEVLPPIVELNENGMITYESADKTEGFVEFTLSVESHGKPISRLCLLRNGRLLHVAKSVPPSTTKITISQVPLLPGTNRFKIFVENQDAQSHTIKSNPIEQVVIGKARYEDDAFINNGMLYVLAVGVSTAINLKKRTSKDEQGFFELNYAHKDARAVFNAFTNENKAFEGMEKTLLVNEQATLENIRKALKEIGEKVNQKIEERITNGEPEKRDVLLVYLSGHGVFRIKNQQLYFWNYDFDLNKPGDTGLAFMDIGEQITSLPAEVILMTDACHSGMAGTDIIKGFNPDKNGIDANELAKRIYGINESDMYIFNAARRSESALEGTSIEHGYFTKAILDALLESTQLGVTMIGLIDQVQWRVRSFTNAQNPVCRMYGDLLPLVIYEK